jgi:hypothetical protein
MITKNKQKLRKATTGVINNPKNETHFRGFGEEGGSDKKNKRIWIPTEYAPMIELLEEIRDILLRIEKK